MNKDIRLKVAFPNHKKTIKLIHLAGHEAFYSLVQLWCYVAQNHPKGILKDYDKDDLEIVSKWTGLRGLFAKSVTKKEIGFVNKIKDGFEINDWEEHNPYVFHADERSEKARTAAKARWEPTDSKGSGDASSMQVAMPLAKPSNAPSPDPSPSPKPIPKPVFSFEEIWTRYPNKDGKKAAEKHFKATVNNEEDYASINIALDKYLDNLKIETWKKPKNGSTWFNNWQDWIDYETPLSQAKDIEIIIDGESQFFTESEYKEWKDTNGK